MADRTLRIKKDNRVICEISSKHTIGYDNFHWWALEVVVNAAKDGFTSKEELIKKINEKTEMLWLSDDIDESTPLLDLDNDTIDMPSFPLYSPEEVNPETCCISLKVVDNKYYSAYEDGEMYPMEYVEFDDVELLNKSKVTLDEFKKVCDFVDGLIEKYNDTDFVLNNKWIIRFNFA